MKQRGTPTYTQHSVAFPNNPLRDRVTDELGVSFIGSDGGTYGGFVFRWIDLGRYGVALRVEAFMDGMTSLLDDRIRDVLEQIARLPQARRDLSPAKLIEWLEAAGVKPSTYHLEGQRS